MNQETIDWIEANELIFRSSIKMTEEQLVGLFAAYSSITGKTMPKTTCARCIKNTIDIVWSAYMRYKKEQQ